MRHCATRGSGGRLQAGGVEAVVDHVSAAVVGDSECGKTRSAIGHDCV